MGYPFPELSPAGLFHECGKLVGARTFVMGDKERPELGHEPLGHDEQAAALRNEVVVGVYDGGALVAVDEHLPLHARDAKLDRLVDRLACPRKDFRELFAHHGLLG